MGVIRHTQPIKGWILSTVPLLKSEIVKMRGGDAYFQGLYRVEQSVSGRNGHVSVDPLWAAGADKKYHSPLQGWCDRKMESYSVSVREVWSPADELAEMKGRGYRVWRLESGIWTWRLELPAAWPGPRGGGAWRCHMSGDALAPYDVLFAPTEKEMVGNRELEMS